MVQRSTVAASRRWRRSACHAEGDDMRARECEGSAPAAFHPVVASDSRVDDHATFRLQPIDGQARTPRIIVLLMKPSAVAEGGDGRSAWCGEGPRCFCASGGIWHRKGIARV